MFFFTTPFYFGVYGHEIWNRIPMVDTNGFKEINSRPLSLRILLIWQLNWMLIKVMKLSNNLWVSYLNFVRKI